MHARTITVVLVAGLLFAVPGSGALAAAAQKSASGARPAAKPVTAAPADTSHHHFREPHPAIYMAWGAPYGKPGARQTASWACDDTLAADTLYLSFDPGEDYEALLGIDATLLFHAAPGDTLGPFWDLSRKGANPFNLRIEFEPAPIGILSPWPLVGVGNVRYAKVGDTGKLDLTYYVQASLGGPIYSGKQYFFAQVMIRMRKAQLTGCLQPVCADFDHLLISHREGSRWINTGQRFTSWNSKDGSVCGEFRKRPPSEEPMRFGGRYDLNQAPGETTPTVRDTTKR